MKTIKKETLTKEEGKSMLEWYKERPEAVQKLAREVPFGKYIINENAEGKYKFSTPGCTVAILGYSEWEDPRNIIVGTLSLSEESKEYVRQMNEEHGKDLNPETSNFQVHVEKEDLTLLDESSVLTARVLELFNNA